MRLSMTDLSFLGATGTATGSKYLISAADRGILVDCGLFQGFKQLRLKNWAPLPVDPHAIHAVVLTHAHIDHSGYLPLLIRNGFRGKVHCTEATRDLCAILLPDSGHLQEEEADYANRRGFSKHKPALPLYTEADGERALAQFHTVAAGQSFDLGQGMSFELIPNGHILGSASVMLQAGERKVLFSGDLGRPDDILMKAPAPVTHADYVIVESTYGDRRHDPADPREELAQVVNRTAERGGIVIVPAFAVGRAQAVLYYLHLLKAARAIPDIPIYLNSPMAADVTRIFRDHVGEHRLTAAQCDDMFNASLIVNSVEEAKRLNQLREPAIIVSASGMATGGRVLHHLKTYAPDPRNTILFVGFQAGGTRGANMVGGADSVKIHGEYIPVRAEVVALNNLSAHADYTEILDWLGHFDAAPRRTFITHGESAAADALRRRIEERFGWSTHVPDYLERVSL